MDVSKKFLLLILIVLHGHVYSQEIFDYNGSAVAYYMRLKSSPDSFSDFIYILIHDNENEHSNLFHLDSLKITSDNEKLDLYNNNSFKTIIYAGSGALLEFFVFLNENDEIEKSEVNLTEEYELYLTLHNQIKPTIEYQIDFPIDGYDLPDLQKKGIYKAAIAVFEFNAELSFVKYKPRESDRNFRELSFNPKLGIPFLGENQIRDSTLVLLNINFNN